MENHIRNKIQIFVKINIILGILLILMSIIMSNKYLYLLIIGVVIWELIPFIIGLYWKSNTFTINDRKKYTNMSLIIAGLSIGIILINTCIKQDGIDISIIVIILANIYVPFFFGRIAAIIWKYLCP